jgi:hypothetical protein
MTAKPVLYSLAAALIATSALGMAPAANADWPPPPPPYVPGYPLPPPPPYVPGYTLPAPVPPNPYQTPIQMGPTQMPMGPVVGGGPDDIPDGGGRAPAGHGGPDDIGGGQASPPATGGPPGDIGGGQPSAPVTGGGPVPAGQLDPNIWLQDPYENGYGVPSAGCGCPG